MIKVTLSELLSVLESILLKQGFKESDAKLCAHIFAENTLVGVSSHGVNRFPGFIESIKTGHINPIAKPTLESSFNAFEQWNGNLGPGPLNANFITSKAIELSKKNGIGCIALRNTNHWMRPGYYAWEAAEQGFILICWTNTIPIMPPWGAKECTIGNNPIVFGIPRKEGNIVLDMALSQYSYGKLATYAREDKELPYIGGYDQNGNLTKNAKDIYETQRPLPVGNWKGSGMALLLDLIATILSGGNSTFDLSKDKVDSGMSQVYISIDPNKFSSAEIIEKSVNEILEYYLSAEKMGEEELSYPGERILKTKNVNLKNGIEINEKIWGKVLKLKREV
jgi:3-dehydro-L-gulonate 2-dehydrogenase